jgi:hypothetical protein
MRRNKKLLYFLFLLIFIIPANSQFVKLPGSLIETGTVVSAGEQTPFWLMSNQYGKVASEKFNGWIRLELKSDLSVEKKIDYDYDLDIIDRQTNSNRIFLYQAYFRVKFHKILFQAGSMEEKIGNQDSSLSSGGLLWSGNARPLPKISIIIPDYIQVPFTGKYLEFKAGISHGWFGDNMFVKDSWLHHKYFYLQLGGSLPVHIHYGLHHFVEWGGESTDPQIGKMPQGFNDFIKVLLAKRGGSNGPYSEQLNALGNHLGSRNFGLDLDLEHLKIGVYWQTIFEDSSGRAFRNIKDGLWGIYLHTKNKDRLINGFVYEFINTTDQSGKNDSYWLLNGVKYNYAVPGGAYHWPVGNDDYFNNAIYQFGWTFHDMVIGTPFITSPAVLKGNDNKSGYLWNNKVTCHHIGLEGKYGNLLYKLFASYYLNSGTNNSPLKPSIPQYSFLLQVQIVNTLPWGISATFALGTDYGKFYGNNAGFRLSLLKQVIK